VPDEETSDEPEPEPGGAPPPAEGLTAASDAAGPSLEAEGEPPPAGGPSNDEPPLTGESLIVEVLQRDPNAARVLAEEFDLPCYRCPARYVETLAGGITYKGLEAEQILSRLRELRGSPVAAGHPSDLPEASA
jgi:hypothetical protein